MASKTLTAKNFSDLMDYSATSVRTMNNSAGQKGFAPHNLILASEDFSDSNWGKTATTVTSNAAMAPDGTLTADKISHTSTSAELRQNTTVVDGQSYTFGIFVKYIDSQWVRVATDQSGSPYGTWFDVQNGVLGTDNSDGASITAFADGWYYLSIPNTANGTSFYSSIFLTGADASAVETSGTEAYIWGAHLYENGLAGMFDVPEDQRALASLTKYLPNTSTTAARFLPRRDNHEYIDGAWVKGLKVESEARTNLVTEAFDGTDASWTKNSAVVALDETGIDGGANSAFTVTDDSSTGTGQVHIAQNITMTSGVEECFSVYAKADQLDWLWLRVNNIDADLGCYFDLTNGVVGTAEAATNNYGIEDVGGGWYRCFITGSTTTDTSGTLRIYVAEGDSDSVVDLDGTSSVILYGIQREAGSTPSSLIPTYGATRTRTAETFTQKSDKIIWPNTTYVDGTELVTNGTFDSDTDWTKGTGWTIGGGTASCDGTQVSTSDLSQTTTFNTGDVIEVTYTVSGRSAGSTRFVAGNDAGQWRNTNGTYTDVLVLTTTNDTFKFQGDSGFVGDIDNISVKEINPRALCVVMHGYMTYADTASTQEVVFWRQRVDASNYLENKLYTVGANVGAPIPETDSNGTLDQATQGDVYSPGVNVPFKIASRHLDNAIQGAADGTATTENTTPPGLPDLSATQAEWFYDGGGFHITDLRVWVQDITEAGITGATS